MTSPETGPIDLSSCLLGSACTFEYCDSGARVKVQTAGNPIENRDDFVLETDPFKLLLSNSASPIARSVAADRALEIFAAQGDVDHALQAALLTSSPEATINRMLRLLPHSVRVFEVATEIADQVGQFAAQPNGIDWNAGLYELIDAHLEADRRASIAPQAGTITAHEVIHEAA